MKYSDQEIIDGILNGKDEKVVSSMYNTLLPGVVKYICANKGTREDAFDLFQDAMLIFVKMVITNKFDATKYRINAYVFTIAKNLWTNKVIRKGLDVKYEKTRVMEEQDEHIVEHLISEERSILLTKVFQSMGEKCKELLTYFYFNGLSMKDIAIKMNLESADVAKLKAYRCRKQLVEKIKSNKFILENLKDG